MNRNDGVYMKVIWERLDQYKAAVVGKKNAEERKALIDSSLKELSEMADYNNEEVVDYFQMQCKNIEARYSFIGNPTTN